MIGLVVNHVALHCPSLLGLVIKHASAVDDARYDTSFLILNPKLNVL